MPQENAFQKILIGMALASVGQAGIEAAKIIAELHDPITGWKDAGVADGVSKIIASLDAANAHEMMRMVNQLPDLARAIIYAAESE